ncbi:MAG: alanine--tRNA ligase, partial [Bacteroidetes bacterium]|nr:alanine--tRNA ligase [Bacteroidota bacterium]
IIDPSYSVELCGGTHVGATGELGIFKIRHESAVAAGVRRIEAVSGSAAEAYIGGQLHELHTVKEALKNPKELTKALDNLIAENAELKKKLEKAEARQLAEVRQQLLQKVETINGLSFIGEVVEVGSADAVKKLAFDLKPLLTAPFLVVLAANVEGKAAVAVLVDDDSVTSRKLEAPALIKEHIAPLIKGGGGGQKTLATAGGQEAGNLPQVIEKVKSILGTK